MILMLQVVWDEEVVLGAVGVLANLGAVLLVDDFNKPRIVAVAKGAGYLTLLTSLVLIIVLSLTVEVLLLFLLNLLTFLALSGGLWRWRSTTTHLSIRKKQQGTNITL
jgi:hypothetical protein